MVRFFFYSTDLAQLPDDLRFEILGLIAMEPSWKSIVDEKVIKKCFRRCSGRLIPSWYGPGLASKMIRDDKYILDTAFGGF